MKKIIKIILVISCPIWFIPYLIYEAIIGLWVLISDYVDRLFAPKIK